MKRLILLAAVFCLAALAACNREPQDAKPPEPKAAPAIPPAVSPPQPQGDTPPAGAASAPKPGATAQLKPASGSKVRGIVSFAETGDGIVVSGGFSGLTPGKHGFHVHETGDCSAPDAKSAGDHFNPDNQQHGAPDSAMHHRGDLGNIEADANGRAQVEQTVKGVTLTGPGSIIGKAVLVHAGEDDLKTPPSGNSGARVACGVIEAA